jgi:hypothetical protein
MPKSNRTLELCVPCDIAIRACRQAAVDTGLRVLREEAWHLSVKEVNRGAISFTYPAKIDVWVLKASRENDSTIELRGSILGLGPIQRSHLDGQIGAFSTRVVLASEQLALTSKAEEVHTQQLSVELGRLAALNALGVLSREEFALAKARLFA